MTSEARPAIVMTDISRTPIGVQVIIECRRKRNPPSKPMWTVIPGQPGWERLKAFGKILQREYAIPGKLVSVDSQIINYILSSQFSFKE